MITEYRNENLKLVTEQQFAQNNFWGFKDYLDNNALKIREKYENGKIKEIHYYKNPNENDEAIVDKYKHIDGLAFIITRERESYGDFWIEKVKDFSVINNVYFPFISRELYNSKNQLIASESIDSSVPETDENHYELVKYYYNSDDGRNGEYFVSHYFNGIFEDIEHFQFGFDTDSQDVERGYYGGSAEQLMIRMGISPKMRAWYVNNDFLPEL